MTAILRAGYADMVGVLKLRDIMVDMDDFMGFGRTVTTVWCLPIMVC